ETNAVALPPPPPGNPPRYNPEILAYDAAGNINCSGTPKKCSPVWGLPTGEGAEEEVPVVSNGVVFAGSENYDEILALNASNGTVLRAYPLGPFGSPTVAGNVLYVAGENNFYAFDATGHTNCPKSLGAYSNCAPLWTAPKPLGPSY